MIETTQPLQVAAKQSALSINNYNSFILVETAKLSLKIREMEKGRKIITIEPGPILHHAG